MNRLNRLQMDTHSEASNHGVTQMHVYYEVIDNCLNWVGQNGKVHHWCNDEPTGGWLPR